jgi:hypothetical protein
MAIGGKIMRSIRLKELAPGTDLTYTPPPAYLEHTDGSLPAEAYACRVDEHGFLITGNEPGTDRTLVFMGDSFVESMYTHEHERFVSVVEREIPGVCCLNASYSGSTTLQLFNNIVNKIYPVAGPGATLVIFPPHSDRDHLYIDGSYWNPTKRGSTIIPAMAAGNTDIPNGTSGFRSMLSLCVAAAYELGMRPVLATTPYRVAPFGSDPVLRAIYRRNTEGYYAGLKRRIEYIEAIKHVAALTGAELIDAEAYLGGDPQYFYDELHLNPAGQAHFGRYLTGQLEMILATKGAH